MLHHHTLKDAFAWASGGGGGGAFPVHNSGGNPSQPTLRAQTPSNDERVFLPLLLSHVLIEFDPPPRRSHLVYNPTPCCAVRLPVKRMPKIRRVRTARHDHHPPSLVVTSAATAAAAVSPPLPGIFSQQRHPIFPPLTAPPKKKKKK